MGKLPVIIVDAIKDEPNISIGSLSDMDIINQLEFLTKTISKLETIRTNKGKQLQKYVALHNFE
jgi:hypothetical protein|tara:strand:+ start:596 stop:787 length:192 start_codon:yes stop_codon:yes gene_type:complete